MVAGRQNPKRRAAAPNDRELLRLLPSVDECLRRAAASGAWRELSRSYLSQMVRRTLDGLRAEIAGGVGALPPSRDAMAEEVMQRAQRAIAADEPRLKTVVNASGVVIHTNLGRALLAEAALEAVASAARAPVNLEYDLESGTRGDRDHLVEEELCALTGAQAATVVNNNAAAVLLALNSLAEGREVIVSRGELIEIGGSFRIPEVMAKSGARLREVGTTNRTHLDDYARAIGAETALLLKVHPSNYRVVGFTADVGLAELVELGAARGIEVIEDLGSGALVDFAAWGLPREPLVEQSIAAGAGLVTFSGDKLLGGPQAGLVVGKRSLTARLKANPLKRALRCDKLTLAALSATLRLYLRASDLPASLPALRLLTRSVAQIEAAAARASVILAERLGPDFRIELIHSTSEIGSGALPTHELETRALRVTHPRLGPEQIAERFRRARPPVIGRIKDGAFQLDLRTVEDPAALAVEFPACGS